MNVDLRKARLDVVEQFFIPLELQRGMKASLHQNLIAAEGHRFHLDQRSGIELPNETTRMLMPTMEWKESQQGERWFPGDTANMAIGQGFVLVTPLDMLGLELALRPTRSEGVVHLV